MFPMKNETLYMARSLLHKVCLVIHELSIPNQCLSFHLSFNREGRWGTTDDFTTSFLQFSLFSTALLDMTNSRPVHFLVLSSSLFLVCLVFFPLPRCLARWFWQDLMNGRHVHTTAVCVSLRWSKRLRVVRMPAGSRYGLPR